MEAHVGHCFTDTKGYQSRCYICGNKYHIRICKAKNMPTNDIDPLVVALLKKSLMDKSMINATADSILAATTSRGDGDVKSLQDEIVSIDAN